MKRLLSVSSLSLLCLLGSLSLSGCSGTASFPDVAAQSSLGSLQGSVFGGHAPIVGAHVFVLEAASAGTAPSGYAAAAKSLLLGPAGAGSSQYPESLDSVSGSVTNGLYYVTTDATGSFNIGGDYTCDAGQPVYLYASTGATSTGTAVTIAAASAVNTSGNAYTVTFTAVNTLTAGSSVALSNLTGNFASLNGSVQTVLSAGLSTAQFEITAYNLSGTSGSSAGTATPLVLNPAIVNLAMLGICPSNAPFNLANSISYVYMNEVSTVATAFSMAGFGTDGLHIGSSSTNKIGLQNAAINANSLYDIQGSNVGTGTQGDAHVARATTPAGNGTVPQAEIDTLGNILAGCVDSTNTTTVLASESSQCSTLFKNATSNGIAYGTTGAGTVPIDIATAAFNIAHNPGANVAALFTTPTSNMPFIPQLPATPTPKDFTVAITYNSITTPQGLAPDGSGNAYVGTNSTSSYVTKLSPTGAVLATSAAAGNAMNAVAVDSNGGVWATAGSSNNLYAYTSSLGAVTGSPFTSWTGSGTLNDPTSVVADNADYVYVTNGQGNNTNVVKISGLPATGTSGAGTLSAVISNSSCYTRVTQLAIDAGGYIWDTVSSNNQVCRVTNPGGGTSFNVSGQLPGPGNVGIDASGNGWVPMSQQSNEPLAKVTSGGSYSYPGVSNNSPVAGMNKPTYVAIDGASNLWLINSASPYSVSELSNAAAAISGSSGYQSGNLNAPGAIAVDISGDVWITNKGGSTVTEMIGAGYPVAPLYALKPGVEP